MHVIGSGEGSDNGVAIEGVFELPLSPWAGPTQNFIPDTFETYFRQTNNATTIEPAIRVTDTLMTDPPIAPLEDFDISIEQRNDVDLTGVVQADGTKFLTVMHKVTTLKGNVSWLGGILYGNARQTSGGPTGRSGGGGALWQTN